MGKFIAVFKREYLERVRTRLFIIMTILAPLFFGGIMIIPQLLIAKGMKNARLGKTEILDATGTGFGDRILRRLVGPMSDTGTVVVRVVAPADIAAAESTATRAVMRDSIAGYVVLDSSTVAGKAARYAGREASQVGQMNRLEGAIRQTVITQRLEQAGLDPARVQSMTNVSLDLSTERITDRGRGGTGAVSTVLGIGIAVLLYITLALYGQIILRSVIEEKSTRVSEVIVSSVPTNTLLAGKVLGVSAVSLTQIVIWLASIYTLYNARGAIFAKFNLGSVPPITLPHVSIGMWAALLAIYVLGFVFYTSLFAALGATATSDQEAQEAQRPVLLLLVGSFVLMQPIMLNPSSPMAKVLSWIPFSAPIVMPVRMTVASLPPLELIGVVLWMAVSCVAAIWVAARIYRIGLLMYGKRPSFPELVRWIKQA